MFRRIGVTGAALLIAGACLIVMGLFIADRTHADRTQAKQTVNTNYIGCLRYNDTRLLFRDVILDAYGDSAQPSTDLSAIPQFQAIEDQAVKDLLLLLTSGPRGETSTSRRDRSYNRTGTRDCDAEFPTHSDGISITTASTIPPPTLPSSSDAP